MNRVILIGNGFDLAHGLKTKYEHFIDDFWNKKSELFQKAYYERKLISQNDRSYHSNKYQDNDIIINDIIYYSNVSFYPSSMKNGFERFLHTISAIDEKLAKKVKFVNQFLEQITNKKTLRNWVDVEEEYYLALNECLKDKKEDEKEDKIEQLNKEFLMIKTSLENYLKEQVANKIDKLTQIEQNINSDISLENFLKKPEFRELFETLYLNFNYTNTEKLYIQNNNLDKVIHIHGELDNSKNPIIFGYGDDIDEKYKLIEQQNDNRYLENIKSIKYLETRNYKKMLKFIDFGEYIIYIMGLSCGNSDRTLLNTLFEHKNCISIKVFYHQREDGTDDYSDVIRNISRNFTEKSLFRKIVVDKTLCVPLS